MRRGGSLHTLPSEPGCPGVGPPALATGSLERRSVQLGVAAGRNASGAGQGRLPDRRRRGGADAVADLGYFRIEQGMLSRGAGAKAGASAAYQSGGRFRTVIAAAAYQAGVGLTIGADLREAWAAKGQDPVSAVADFTGKSGVHHTDIRVPAGAPAWCADRQTLWTRVELSERRRDATLALQYTLSLSREVPIATSIRSVERFVDEHLVARKLVADIAIHLYGRPLDPTVPAVAEKLANTVGLAWPVIPVARVPSTPPVDGPHALELPDGRLVVYQPHAHVLATTRPLVDGALGPKDRDLARKAFLIGSRKLWEQLCNEDLAQTGATHRVSQRSKWHSHRQQQDLGGAAGSIPEPLSQVPLGPAYHPVVDGRALNFGGVDVMPHQFNAIVAELEKSRRAAPDEKSVRLARAVVRIEELEAQGVRFSRETGGMVKVEAPSGVVVDWHDRALWSGIHAMVLDYLEARDAERKAHAPEPGTVGIAVPGASDRMSTAPEPPAEAARLREELDAATRSVATIAAATGQAQPDVAASLADGIVIVARGAMATAYERSRGVLMREQQARVSAETRAEELTVDLARTKAALALEQEKRRATDADCGALRAEGTSLRQQLAEAKRSAEAATITGAAAARQADEDRQARHRAEQALRLVRQAVDTDATDEQLASELRKRLQAASRQSDAVEAAARSAGLTPELVPSEPGARLRAIAQANRDRALDEVATLLDAPVRALGVHLRGAAAERVPAALAILTTAIEGRDAELARERASREQAELEAQGWKRAYQTLVRHGRRLMMLLARQAGLVEPAKAAWHLLMDAISHGKEPGDLSTVFPSRRNDAPARGEALNRSPRQEEGQQTGQPDKVNPDAEAAPIMGGVKPPPAIQEPLEAMIGEKPRPSGMVAGAVRLTSAATEAVRALETRLKVMSKDDLLEAAQETERAAREAGEEGRRNEHRHVYSVIARIARQRGVALQPLQPSKPRIRDEYAR